MQCNKYIDNTNDNKFKNSATQGNQHSNVNKDIHTRALPPIKQINKKKNKQTKSHYVKIFLIVYSLFMSSKLRNKQRSLEVIKKRGNQSHSYFSTVQRSTIGTFISVSGTHEMERPEHLSQSTHTHTVHSMELWSARQSLLQTYVPSKRTGSRVCHPSCSLHPFLHHCYAPLREVTHIQRHSWTYTHIHIQLHIL